MLHSLAHQGINRETYLRIAGRDEEEIVEQSKPDAEQALRREAVLAAIIEAEGIEPTEEEVLRGRRAGGRRGRRARLAEEAARAAEVDRPARHPQGRTSPSARRWTWSPSRAKPISIEQAQARDKLWTPGDSERAKSGSTGQLWTPGS